MHKYCNNAQQSTSTNGQDFHIQGKLIKSGKNIKLLGIQLDYKLIFEPRVSELCRKAASQLNVLKDSENLLILNKGKFLSKTLCTQILIIILFYGTFHQVNLCKKLKRSKKVPLDFYIMSDSLLKMTYL